MKVKLEIMVAMQPPCRSKLSCCLAVSTKYSECKGQVASAAHLVTLPAALRVVEVSNVEAQV